MQCDSRSSSVTSSLDRFSNSVNIFYVVENSASVKYRRCAVRWDGMDHRYQGRILTPTGSP